MDMFQCMSDTAVVPRPNPVSGAKQTVAKQSADEETIDKLVHECLKLKKKNKELRTSLLSVESKQNESFRQYETTIEGLQDDNERAISQMKANQFIELSQLRDYRVQEVDELTRQLHIARKELSNQNPLVIAMTGRISALELEMDSLQHKHSLELESLQNEFVLERNKLIMNRNENVESQKAALMKRALSAENEMFKLQDVVTSLQLDNQTSARLALQASLAETNAQYERLEAEHLALDASYAQLKSSLEGAATQLDNKQAALVQQQDLVAYYEQENARLEKQVVLIKRELEKVSTRSAAAGVSSSASSRPVSSTSSTTATNIESAPATPRHRHNMSESALLNISTSYGEQSDDRWTEEQQQEGDEEGEMRGTGTAGRNKTPSAEERRLLQENEVLNTKLRGHQKKISQLQRNIKELVRTKSAVEEGVQSVLRDNEELSRANEILNRDNLALCDEVEVLRLKKGR